MSKTWAGARTGVVAGLALAALFGPAMAATASLHWSTFLRAGPGAQYVAVDELEHGASLDVGACAGQWCRVSDGAVIGYVDREALLLPAAPTGATAASQTCFRSAQTSYKGSRADPLLHRRARLSGATEQMMEMYHASDDRPAPPCPLGETVDPSGGDKPQRHPVVAIA